MPVDPLYRFIEDGKRFVIDTETCFCFECDDISWDVLEHYPNTPVNRIKYLLRDRHEPDEVEEVVGELEWLRHTKAILPHTTPEEAAKKPKPADGLQSLTVCLPHEGAELRAQRRWLGGKAAVDHSSGALDLGLDSLALLQGRGTGGAARFELRETGTIRNPELVANLCRRALKNAALADRDLTVEVSVAGPACSGLPAALDEHGLTFHLVLTNGADPDVALRSMASLEGASLARWVKALYPGTEGVTGRAVLRPGRTDIAAAVQALHKAGFNWIELDLAGSYTTKPGLSPTSMAEALKATSRYYAERLAANDYFRLDPMAELFNHIYEGTPNLRADPSGAHALFVDSDGAIYPSTMLTSEAFRLGSIKDGGLDEAKRDAFYELGAENIGVCRSCWAHSLCGGGSAAVHYAFTGDIHTPNQAWCESQRTWLAASVAAFNVLSTHGVDFTRVYRSLTRTGKPSLFAALRAAFKQTVGMRPIQEADGRLLSHWEEWNDAAYFLCNESGIMLTTQYDREMDALHPYGQEQEFMLIHRDGTPFGLFKVRPDRVKGAAEVWMYLHDEAEYASETVRKGMKALLAEAGAQQELRRLTIPATASEKSLHGFLEAIGFKREGTLREALFLHDAYHDVHYYGLTLNE